jgi:D-serine deaminase-like pyridoxal phosphate-dependent protein
MTPPPTMAEEDYTPREAAERLYALCDELERLEVPHDQVEELRALSERFHRHMQNASVFWERLQDYARRQRPCC